MKYFFLKRNFKKSSWSLIWYFNITKLKKIWRKIPILIYYKQCCGSGSRGSGTLQSPGSGFRSLKRKTATKIIRKSYLHFLREDLFFFKVYNMAIFYSYIIWSLIKNLGSSLKRNKNHKNILKFFDFGSDSSWIRIRCKIVWIRNTDYKQHIRWEEGGCVLEQLPEKNEIFLILSYFSVNHGRKVRLKLWDVISYDYLQ